MGVIKGDTRSLDSSSHGSSEDVEVLNSNTTQVGLVSF